jgi:hypothetical protein
MAFIGDKEHPRRAKVNRRRTVDPADYWIGGFGSRLLPGSITKV